MRYGVLGLGITVLVLWGGSCGAATGPSTDRFVSSYGFYRIWIPPMWHVVHKRADEVGEHVILNPGPQKAVEINLIVKRSPRPMVAHEIDSRMNVMFQNYQKNFMNAKIERGPNVVPLGNQDSVGYMVIYNTAASEKEKMSVRETFNFINLKWGPSRYLHVTIISRCPLYLADTYSMILAKCLKSLQFMIPTDEDLRRTAAAESDGRRDAAKATDQDSQDKPAPDSTEDEGAGPVKDTGAPRKPKGGPKVRQSPPGP